MACVLKLGLLAVAAASDPVEEVARNQTQLSRDNSTRNISAAQQAYMHEYADQYRDQYAPGGNQNTGQGSNYGQDSNWQRYVPANVRHYIPKTATQNSSNSQGGNYAQYAGGYASQSSNYSHFYSQYLPQGVSPTMMAAQGGADYQKYMQGQGGQGQGSNYSHYYSQYMGGSSMGGASNYSQYMQQGGSSMGGASNYSQYMQQGGSPTMMVAQAQNKSDAGFQRYLDRYLPSGDGQYADSYTSRFSDQTASQESIGSTGSFGYDQYVDRYSAMAGPHPSSGSDWHSQSASQSSAYQNAVGSHISGGGTGFLGGSAAANAPAAAVEAPAAATAQASATAAPEVSLAASPTRSEAEASHWSSVQLVACIFAGFSLPASLAFLSTLRKSSRSLTDFEETGFQRLIEV